MLLKKKRICKAAERTISLPQERVAYLPRHRLSTSVSPCWWICQNLLGRNTDDYLSTGDGAVYETAAYIKAISPPAEPETVHFAA